MSISMQYTRGAEDSPVETEAPASPADAFFAAFREATQGVRFSTLADEPGDIARVAGAFRTAELHAAAWVRQRLGWEPAAARDLTQDLVLAAGDWLLAGTDDVDALRHELRFVWRAREEDGAP
jgi:hypothetical protein